MRHHKVYQRGIIGLLIAALLFSIANLFADKSPLVFEQLTKSRLEDLRTAYEAIKDNVGPKTDEEQVVLLYHIGEQSADYDTMGEVIEQLKMLRKSNPNDAEITAYLGSAYALRARDYPWQGFYQIIPGPGFVRLGYTWKGVHLLNKAATENDRNPIVRMLRGMTFTRLPRLFGQFGTGLGDLTLLRGWIEDPNTNPQYVDILKDPAFRGDVYFRLAEAHWLDGNEADARRFFAHAVEAAPAGSPIAIAAREMVQ
uniref:Tetratricopeptide repeat-containing protein n=1 Tax=Candidatus Kentrum sp. FM TaxID=2126340 RepID=A0A450VS04_9GAMM|nr:MAG: hypothetical protein BECKFM1743A_GA0114220_100428 [Candidatus Kentron sp. FM]VFJ47335.1 MAG: hypothetical protein BECKFM1743C_GA0114222_100448 [Candidatus Kentron sp. FM]VFK07557.1 MAG: hypothetical protein BECKFM1743B_GA0114221_100447 [Candidatus Kentron sp. FM]